jgi:hypothetical protein
MKKAEYGEEAALAILHSCARELTIKPSIASRYIFLGE